MGNFIGGLSGIEQPLAQWENIWGTVEENRQRRWTNRETRTALDRENRRQRDLSQVELDAQGRRAGLFEGVDAQFSAMGRRNVPNAVPTGPAASAPGGGPGAMPSDVGTQQQAPATNNRNLSLTSAEMQSLFRHRGGSRLGFRQYTPEEIANNPQLRDVLERGQRYMQLQVDEVQNENGETVYRVQQRTQGSVSGQNFAVPEANTILGVPLSGEDARNMRGAPMLPLNPEYGRNVRENSDSILQRSRTTDSQLPGNTASSDTVGLAEIGAGVAGPQGGSSEAPTDQFYRGDPDTSAALEPTPEMRMMHEAIQSELERAQVNARYGNSEQAQVHFAQALQAQAAYLQQSRLVMLRAASQGHRTALADLIGLYSGRPEGTTRIAPTGEAQDRFHIEVLNNENQWVSATSNPLTLGQLFERAEFLVDRESVMARSDANSEIIQANIRAGVDMYEAQLTALTAQQRMYVDAAIANASNESREAISQGDGQLIVDSTNNRAYLRYWRRDASGQPEQVTEEITQQDMRVPDTNGRRTEPQSVRRPINGSVTGTVGVRSN